MFFLAGRTRPRVMKPIQDGMEHSSEHTQSGRLVRVELTCRSLRRLHWSTFGVLWRSCGFELRTGPCESEKQKRERVSLPESSCVRVSVCVRMCVRDRESVCLLCVRVCICNRIVRTS